MSECTFCMQHGESTECAECVREKLEALVERNHTLKQLPEPMVSRFKQLNSFAWDDEEQSSLQVQSLLSLEIFFQLFKPEKLPSLTAALDGKVIAEWRKNKNNLLTLEFLTSGEVKFIFFRRYGSGESEVTRLSGISSITELPDFLNWDSVAPLLSEFSKFPVIK